MSKASAPAKGGAAPDELAQTKRELNDAVVLTQLVASNFDARAAETAKAAHDLLKENSELRRANAELTQREQETYRFMQKQIDDKVRA
jgi:hypothetical protein